MNYVKFFYRYYMGIYMKRIIYLVFYIVFFLSFISLFGSGKVYAGPCENFGNASCGAAGLCCSEYIDSFGYPAADCYDCSSSFLPGTLVKTSSETLLRQDYERASKKIEDIRVGDEVLSFKDETVTYSKVIKIFKYPKPYYYTLEAGEYMVKVTYNHPFYIGSNQFKIVEELKIGDTIYVLENGYLTAKEITQKTKINKSTTVYNLTVDNTNTYFANDFAVHNKGSGAFGCPGGTYRSCGTFTEAGAMYDTTSKGTCNTYAASYWA
ncbi:MAG: YD repeat protein, partial [uncultured bacterium]